MHTPEFLAWAIDYSCPVRGFQDGSDPERTERQLRAVRAFSDAQCENRVFEGHCVTPPYGFRIDEALAMYGGQPAAEQACLPCPANALARSNARFLAGCFGSVPLPEDKAIVHTQVEQAVDRLGLARDLERHFPATSPRWYGLWIKSPLDATQQSLLRTLMTAIDIADEPFMRAWKELDLGLEAALAADRPFHAVLYPAGRVEGTWWNLTTHCPRCRGTWPGEGRQHCRVCGYEGQPAQPKKRRARGRRPYRLLQRLLGAEGAAEFLVRYDRSRSAQRFQDQGQSPPLPGPPDNHRAD